MLKKSDYLSLLNRSWVEHLKMKVDNSPTFISTFSGCGGSSLGYSMAGFRELLAVEWNENAVQTFKQNFPAVPVYHGDIADLLVEEILSMTGLRSGELDILDGSPPCQGFSTIGRRQIDDPRNSLFKEYVRILRGLRPKVFVMENVSGMVKGIMKFIFVEILQELKLSGYHVSARLLNSMYFNVPQSRERMIFIGVRNDLRSRNDLEINPSFPMAESYPVTTREAFEKLEQDLDGCLLKENWQMTRVLEGKERKRHFGLVRIDFDKPSSTIVKDAGNTTSGIIHPEENRRLSIPEIKRISSYPDSFVFVGNYREKWERIGNSVPPLFMRSIANHINQNILKEISQV